MRSKGVGSTLLKTVERQAALDATELRLEVWTANRRRLASTSVEGSRSTACCRIR
jgi:hypothetical protein